MFPSDDILIARGKYSTLNRERREQIKRVQKIAETLQAKVYAVVATVQTQTPSPEFSELQTCLKNLESASTKIVQICTDLQALHPKAWGDSHSE